MSEQPQTNVWKEISATWDGSDSYAVQNPAGGRILIGTDKDGNRGLGPMELLLAGLAGCTGMDIISILDKKRQKPADFQVRVRGNQKTDVYPKTFVEYQVEYLLWGENLVAKDVEQAIQLSEEKYCSVGGTLSKSGPVHSSYRILKPGESAE